MGLEQRLGADADRRLRFSSPPTYQQRSCGEPFNQRSVAVQLALLLLRHLKPRQIGNALDAGRAIVIVGPRLVQDRIEFPLSPRPPWHPRSFAQQVVQGHRARPL